MTAKRRLRNMWPIAAIILVVGVTIQFIQQPVQNVPVSYSIIAPRDVTQIFKKACYDCHSNETRLHWYDKVAPISWLVKNDVTVARSRFNFSTWDTLKIADRQVRIWEMLNMVLAGKMPLRTYAALHPEARLTPHDVDVLKKYAASISPAKYHDTSEITKAGRERENFKPQAFTNAKVPIAPNGVKFISGFKNWQVISTTSRFDNHTMRVIYGNNITVKAIKSGQINPLPNGAAIVKAVWNSIEERNGEVNPGAFNNIQMMIKDDKRFPDSKGWGFAKFTGTELTPFGGTAVFNAACFNCHKIADKTGFVFSLPVENKKVKTIKREVFDAEGLRVITAFANRKKQTLSVLYGYPLSLHRAAKLVTFRQVDHPSWYGSYINGDVLSVDTINKADAYSPLIFPQ